MNQYYYADESGNSVGPVSSDELMRLHKDGVIRSTTLITEANQETWIPLYKFGFTSGPSADTSALKECPLCGESIGSGTVGPSVRKVRERDSWECQGAFHCRAKWIGSRYSDRTSSDSNSLTPSSSSLGLQGLRACDRPVCDRHWSVIGILIRYHRSLRLSIQRISQKDKGR